MGLIHLSLCDKYVVVYINGDYSRDHLKIYDLQAIVNDPTGRPFLGNGSPFLLSNFALDQNLTFFNTVMDKYQIYLFGNGLYSRSGYDVSYYFPFNLIPTAFLKTKLFYFLFREYLTRV